MVDIAGAAARLVDWIPQEKKDKLLFVIRGTTEVDFLEIQPKMSGVNILIRGITLCFLLVGMFLVLISCDKEDQEQKQIELQQTTINELQLKLRDSNQKIDQLTEDLKAKRPLQTELDLVFLSYPWLKKLNSSTKWDKIIIYRYENDPAKKTITDPLFLESINWLLHIRSVGTVNFPSGYQTDIDTYTYEFYEGEQKYTIKVVDRGVIEAGRNELYFEVDKDIHQLGAAFIPKRLYIKHDGLIAKMAASGAVKRGEQYVQLSASRVQARIAPLMDGKLLKNKPEQIGEITETYIFYYYGNELVMNVYKDYVLLTGDGSEEWYYYKDAEVMFNVEAG